MKHMAYLLANVTLLLLGTMIVLVLMGKEARRIALENVLAQTMEETVKSCQVLDDEQPKDTEEMISDFVTSFEKAMHAEGEYCMEIMQADAESGILSVRVTETFSYPNGKEGSLQAFRTVIKERFRE